jgi:hypothetical protein
MRPFERDSSPEQEYAARLATIFRFGETAARYQPHYTIANDVSDELFIRTEDGLHDLQKPRLEEGQRHIEALHETLLGFTGISAHKSYYDALEISRVYHDEHILNTAFAFHMLYLTIGGKQAAKAEQFIFQMNDYCTFREVRFLKFGGTTIADRIVYPRQDELTQEIDVYFARKDPSHSGTIQALINAALIGSEAAARHLRGVTSETATEESLKQLLRRVLDRHRVVGTHEDSTLQQGPPSDDELDMVTRILFRAVNAD